MSEAWRRFRQDRAAVVGLVLLAALAIFALAGPLVARWSPDASDFDLTRGPLGAPPGPSREHWLGTDVLFRDVFSRLAHGARVSLAVAMAATALATGVGLVAGVLSGMCEGTRLAFVDTIAMRLVDVLLALPFLLFVMAIGLAVGHTDLGTVLLVLGGAGWTGAARLVRARTLQIKALDYVAAARALGAGPFRIAVRHVIPNLAGMLLVLAGASVAQMILAEAVLGYLTVGVPPPEASWGRMLHEAEPFIATRPALLAAPGFAILVAVLGWNRVADGLRDALDAGDRASMRSVRPPGRTPVDLLLAAAALLLLSLATPAPVAPPRGETSAHPVPRRGGVFHGAVPVNLRTLDPALASDEAAGPLLQLVFARLVTWDERGEIVPDLASTFSISPDGRAYTFALREGATFHDGAPVLARDVARSLERLLHPRTASPAASWYAKIRGYPDFHAGRAPHLDGVRVLGDRLVAVELTEPDATFLSKLTMSYAAPVCASAGVSADRRARGLPCGAGPFRVASWDPDRSVQLSRHEGYGVPGRPYLDGVEWSVGVPPVAQRYRFERGEIDYVTQLRGGDRDLFLASPSWAGLGRWTVHPTTEGIFLGTEVPPFDRREIRRAVALALDPSAAARMRPELTEADRIIPPGIPGPSRTEAMRRHDLAAALGAMARAGFPFDPASGRGGWPAPIDYLTVPDTGDQQVAEIWQQQLARIGLRLRLRLVTFAAWDAESGRRGGAAMGRDGWGADFPDASNFFEPLLSSAAIQDAGSTNRSFFSSPEIDALLARARAEPDRAQRDALFLRAEQIVRDEAPWIPTHGVRGYELWQPYVHGYPPHPVIPQRFANVWIDRDAPPFVLGSVLRGRR